MTPLERRRAVVPPGELAVIDHAAEIQGQLELALPMLAIAVDLLAAVTGKDSDEVLAVLERCVT